MGSSEKETEQCTITNLSPSPPKKKKKNIPPSRPPPNNLANPLPQLRLKFRIKTGFEERLLTRLAVHTPHSHPMMTRRRFITVLAHSARATRPPTSHRVTRPVANTNEPLISLCVHPGCPATEPSHVPLQSPEGRNFPNFSTQREQQL